MTSFAFIEELANVQRHGLVFDMAAFGTGQSRCQDLVSHRFPLYADVISSSSLQIMVTQGFAYKATEKPSRPWIKVKNLRYRQLEGREELFERAKQSQVRQAGHTASRVAGIDCRHEPLY